MTTIPVGKYECETCLAVAPFTYARCLKGILQKKATLCEMNDNAVLSTAKCRLGKGRTLKDVIREKLRASGPTSLKVLVEQIPEYSKGSISYALSSMRDVKAQKVPGKRWSIFFLRDKNEL